MIKNENKIINIFTFVFAVIAVIWTINYFVAGTTTNVENEIDRAKEHTVKIETTAKQLETDISKHNDRIASSAKTIKNSANRLRKLQKEVKSNLASIDRAVAIVEECENIIETAKTEK